MKVTAMRDHRDMKTTSTTKIFSDLKAYEFEHEPKDADEPETRNVALVANQQASTSNRKMKRFMRKNNFQDFQRSGHRRKHESSPQTSKQETSDSQLLCYNCRKPGHFKANCPHPIVSKHQDGNAVKSPSKEAGENYKRNDKPESSNSRNERRRKSMVVNETSDTIEAESSSSSSSSDEDSTEEEKGLLCLFSQESDELCLMADDDEVNSQSSSCYSAESSSIRSQASNESVTEMMREFKIIKNTYSKLKEENSQLMISYNALRQVRIENIKLAITKDQLEKNVLALKEQCTERKKREQQLREILNSFNNSSNLMDRMVNGSRLPEERTGIGFDPSSSSQIGLNKSTNAYSQESFQSAFVQGPTQMSEPMTNRQYRPKSTRKNPTQGIPRNGQIRQNERSFKRSGYGNGWTGPSEEDCGCSRHMTDDKEMLSNFKEIDGPKVIFGGETSGKTRGTGDIIKNGITIQDVSFKLGMTQQVEPPKSKDNQQACQERSRERCFIHNNGKNHLKAFDERADEGLFMGYSSASKAFRILNKRTIVIEESIHVKFNEKSEKNPVGIKSSINLNQSSQEPNEKKFQTMKIFYPPTRDIN
ncbi:PREDICTED: uncharacterized protein LOC109157431 [Ipomoea nil]|uniref:uncharacterized protein LOC109157431 n=1 Tax=Ipomoea nil TaxID=35883 RepID=UPI000900F241|nr:PREDICTED: uncharacterized protein LOC109157431 [Ipomoea nil]